MNKSYNNLKNRFHYHDMIVWVGIAFTAYTNWQAGDSIEESVTYVVPVATLALVLHATVTTRSARAGRWFIALVAGGFSWVHMADYVAAIGWGEEAALFPVATHGLEFFGLWIKGEYEKTLVEAAEQAVRDKRLEQLTAPKPQPEPVVLAAAPVVAAPPPVKTRKTATSGRGNQEAVWKLLDGGDRPETGGKGVWAERVSRDLGCHKESVMRAIRAWEDKPRLKAVSNA